MTITVRLRGKTVRYNPDTKLLSVYTDGKPVYRVKEPQYRSYWWGRMSVGLTLGKGTITKKIVYNTKKNRFILDVTGLLWRHNLTNDSIHQLNKSTVFGQQVLQQVLTKGV